MVVVAGIIFLPICISIIVSFHEYGHYSVARLFNTRIERFSVGFGKILLRRYDKRGVEWALSALPLGGYVKFAGDDNIASMAPSREELDAAREAITEREGAAAVKEYFHFKPLWQRFLIILAGPAFNFILAIGIFSLIFGTLGETIGSARIDAVRPNTPAAAAGLKPGDVIKSINGKTVDSGTDVQRMIALNSNTPTRINVDRGSQSLTIVATPLRGTIGKGPGGEAVTGGYLGIQLTDKFTHRQYNPITAIGRGARETWVVVDTNLTYIGRIFSGKENGDQLTGVIGMAKTAGDMAADVAAQKETVLEKSLDLMLRYVQLVAYISIGVGFVNLLPVPMLDGGHLAFYLIQSVTRKPVSARIQTAAYPIAIALIIGLMLFAGWNDINHAGLVQYLSHLFS